MDAKKCDRCGKLYTNDYKSIVERMERHKNRTVEITIEYANAYQTRDKLDLCEECERRLFSWLDGGVKNDI